MYAAFFVCFLALTGPVLTHAFDQRKVDIDLGSSSLQNAVGIDINYLGLRILEGNQRFARMGDTTSCPVKPWTEAQTTARTRTAAVEFSQPFSSPPSVSVSLSSLDMSKDYNIRYYVKALDVTKTGFTIEFGIWCNTYVYSAVIDWQAIG